MQSNVLALYPTITVSDLNKSKDFYQHKLKLEVKEEVGGGIMYSAGDNLLFVYQKDNLEVVDHTLAGFQVEDIEKTVDELTQNGIVFLQYDMPPYLMTDAKGIASNPPIKAAWFKDPDGNILGITQRIQ